MTKTLKLVADVGNGKDTTVRAMGIAINYAGWWRSVEERTAILIPIVDSGILCEANVASSPALELRRVYVCADAAMRWAGVSTVEVVNEETAEGARAAAKAAWAARAAGVASWPAAASLWPAAAGAAWEAAAWAARATAEAEARAEARAASWAVRAAAKAAKANPEVATALREEALALLLEIAQMKEVQDDYGV